MKTKITHRNIQAYRTGDPAEIVRLLQEAEKLSLPEQLYNMGEDIIATVRANVQDRNVNGAAAAYLLRIAYIIQQEGRLTLAPPKPPRKKKPLA